jgi:PAS domain S-box-containing protein
MSIQSRTLLVRYGGALAVTALAVVLRLLLNPLLGEHFPLLTLFAAVLFIAWYGGRGPASFSLVIGSVVGAYLFFQPRYALTIGHTEDQIGLAIYAALGIGSIAMIESLRNARRHAEENERQLEQEVAARRSAVEELAREEDRLRTTLASIGDAVITTDAAGHITSLNQVAETLTGWTSVDAAGKPLDAVFRIVNEATRKTVENPAKKALSAGVVVGLANHTVLIARDGSEVAIDDSAAPIRSSAGTILGCVLVFRDITERRRLEMEVASRLRAARLLAAIVESSDDAIISKSLDGIIQSWNTGAERLFGFTAEQAVGRHISLIIPADRLVEEDRIIATLKTGQRIDHFDTVRMRKDGETVAVSLTISPIMDEAGLVIGASKIARDITERKRAEADRQNFVALIQNSTDFIGMCDLQGVPFFINRAGLEMVGLDGIEQARNTPVSDFFFPEDQPRMMKEFFPMVREKGHGETEVRFRHFKTAEARWMAYKVLILNDADGRATGFATVSQDVTERRQLADELRQLAADLSEADRRKDEFLATLSHEFRNLLAPMRNALQIVRLSHQPDAWNEARILMDRQLGQLVRLVDDLLDVSRISQGKLELRKEQVQLAAVIGSAVETSRPLIDRLGHQLVVTLPDRPVYLNADPTRLTQVFSNLLNNSAKYMDRGGRIQLTASQHESNAVISVRDTGIGIAPEQLAHIFHMYSQVDSARDRAQGGLGIGLTLVKRLVEIHGGAIEATSEGLGKGSEFVVRLPAVAAAAGIPSPNEHAKPAGKTASLRILVVDDNRDSAYSLAKLLRLMGHEARTAYDGQEGVAAAQEFQPDVTLLDIGLPGLNGYEACRRIREQPWGKTTTLIAVTGWGQADDRRSSREAGFDHHMTKPVDPDELLKLLADFQALKS